MPFELKLATMLSALAVSVILHEMAHAWVALKLGDPTGRDDGRLSFNPIVHIDPWMTIILPLLLLFASNGRFVFGGAKPVRINPLNFRDPSRGMMLSSAAGPLSNLALAVAGLAILFLLNSIDSGFVVGRDDGGVLHITYNGFFFCYFILVNVTLAAFNLVPIPPLDGSRVLRHFLPEGGRALMDRIEPLGMLILMGLMMFTPFFSWVLAPAYLAWGHVMEALFGGDLTIAFLAALFEH